MEDLRRMLPISDSTIRLALRALEEKGKVSWRKAPSRFYNCKVFKVVKLEAETAFQPAQVVAPALRPGRASDAAG